MRLSRKRNKNKKEIREERRGTERHRALKPSNKGFLLNTCTLAFVFLCF